MIDPSLLLLGTILLFLSSTATAKKKEREDCSPFPHPFLPHGRIVATNRQSYSFVCDPGHTLASPRTIRCFKGKWTSTKKPRCQPAGNRCDDPPPLEGGKILGENRNVSSVILYTCDPGFQMVGKPQRTCLKSRHWSGVTPTCVDQSLEGVSKRLRDKFIVPVGSHSSESVGRALDPNSVRNGLDLIIMIDRSSSIDPEDLRRGISFTNVLLRTFGVKNVRSKSGTRAAVMTFGSTADIVFNLDDERITGPLAAEKILDEIKPEGGGTAMEEAFMNAFTSLSPLREAAKKAIFMITDGVPNSGTEENTIIFARNLREIGFEIFTVGIGPAIDRQLLAKLASEPTTNHVFVIDKHSDFDYITKIITEPPKTVRVISPSQCGYLERPEHWPWLAALYVGFPSNESRLGFCSGVLVCKQWVLTAASCLFRPVKVNETSTVVNATKEIFIVMGERDLSAVDPSQHNFYASQVLIHPKFDPLDDLVNNLALLKLNAPASVEKYRPACFPPTDAPVPLYLNLKTNASVAGWGLSASDEREINGGTVSLFVANSTTSLEEEGRCAEAGMFCTTSRSHRCISNLGSPIMALNPAAKNLRLHYLLGVESSRSKCQTGINRFSELTRFLPWINEVTNHCHREHELL